MHSGRISEQAAVYLGHLTSYVLQTVRYRVSPPIALRIDRTEGLSDKIELFKQVMIFYFHVFYITTHIFDNESNSLEHPPTSTQSVTIVSPPINSFYSVTAPLPPLLILPSFLFPPLLLLLPSPPLPLFPSFFPSPSPFSSFFSSPSEPTLKPLYTHFYSF